MVDEPGRWPQSWDDWSRQHRDERERAALRLTVRARRAEAGLAHEAATRVFSARVRHAALTTCVLVGAAVVLWTLVLSRRDASIASGTGDMSHVPVGLALLVVTAAVAVVVVRGWRRVLATRPDRLTLDAQPDSPDTPRHPSFGGASSDGSNGQPRRW